MKSCIHDYSSDENILSSILVSVAWIVFCTFLTRPTLSVAVVARAV